MNHDHQQVTDLIREYQRSRTSGPEPDKRVILSEISTHEETNALHEDDGDNEITRLYKAYQRQRDAERFMVRQTIMAAAREKLSRDHPEPDTARAWPGTLARLFTLPGKWLDEIATYIRVRPGIPRLAIPAAGLLSLAILFTLTIHLIPTSNTATDVAAFPKLLAEHATQLTDTLLSGREISFAFSGDTTSNPSPFEAGIKAMDLKTAAAAGNTQLAEPFAEALYPFMTQAEQAQLRNDLANPGNHRFIHKLTTEIGNNLNEHDAALYRFGQWLEQTRLIAILSLDQEAPEWLAKELSEINTLPKEWRQLLPPSASKQFGNLEKIARSEKIGPNEVYEAKRILARIQTIMSMAAAPNSRQDQ